MTLFDYIAASGSYEILAEKITEYFNSNQFDDNSNVNIICQDREEMDYLLTLIQQYTNFNLGFNRDHYSASAYPKWRRVYYARYCNEIHCGSCCNDDYENCIELTELLEDCIDCDDPRFDDFNDLPDLTELLCFGGAP